MTWTPAEDARLIELVKAGNSYTQTGDFMQRTKGSVVGRAHRLQALGLLPVQQNPCKPRPGHDPKRPYVRRSKEAIAAAAAKALEAATAPPVTALPALPFEVPAAQAGDAPPARPVRTCMMPKWKDGERPYLYCSEPVAWRYDKTGAKVPATYCEPCYRRAYTPGTWRLAA